MLGRFLEYSIADAGYSSVARLLQQARILAGASRRDVDASLCGRHRRPNLPGTAPGVRARARAHLRQAGLASTSRCARTTRAAIRVSPSRQRCVQRARLARSVGSPDTAGRGSHLQPEQAPRERHLVVRLLSRDCAARAEPRRGQGVLGEVRVRRHRRAGRRCCRTSPAPATRSTSDSTNPRTCSRPRCCSTTGDVAGTLARLADVGVLPTGQVPLPLRQRPATALTAPEGTPILLVSALALAARLSRPAP